MSKREKIILGMTIVVALVAGYVQFFMPSGKGEATDFEAKSRELRSFVTETSAMVAGAKPEENAVYKTVLAVETWRSDPFLKTDERLTLEKTTAFSFPDFLYTGFVGMGSRRVAVVNGMEYETGQELSPPGFVLKRIYPDRIVVGVKDKEQETTVPLVEETF